MHNLCLTILLATPQINIFGTGISFNNQKSDEQVQFSFERLELHHLKAKQIYRWMNLNFKINKNKSRERDKAGLLSIYKIENVRHMPKAFFFFFFYFYFFNSNPRSTLRN